MGLQQPRRWHARFLCLIDSLYPLCKTRGPPHTNWGEPHGKTSNPPPANEGLRKGLPRIWHVPRRTVEWSSRAQMGTDPGYTPFGHQRPPTGTLSCGLCNKVLGGWGSAGARRSGFLGTALPLKSYCDRQRAAPPHCGGRPLVARFRVFGGGA